MDEAWEERAHEIPTTTTTTKDISKGKLWLGDIWAAAQPERFNVTCVVNCAPTQVKRSLQDIAGHYYMEVDLNDSFNLEKQAHDDAAAHFASTAAFISLHLGEGRSVLVHCAGGVSRSATIVIAYVLQACGMTLAEAFDHVRQSRPVIGPNAGFMSQLLDLELRLYGKESMQRPLNAHQRSFFPLRK